MIADEGDFFRHALKFSPHEGAFGRRDATRDGSIRTRLMLKKRLECS
jgi:hypothetical protein